MAHAHARATGVNLEETHGTELSANFYAHFQTRKNDISAKLDNLKISGKTLLASHPDILSISSDIANLRRDLVEATPHLPAYDQGKCEQQLKIMEEIFSQVRAPRAKFTFKRSPAISGTNNDGNTTKPTGIPATAINSLGSTPVIKANSISSPTSNLTLSSRASENLNISCLASPGNDLPSSSDVTLVHLSNCFVNFFPPQMNSHTGLESSFRMTALHGKDLDRTIVLIPHVDGSVLLHNIHNTVIIIACRQFRIHDSTNTTVLLDVLSNPIIERSSNLRFGTFPEQLKYALSEVFANRQPTNYSVQDFDWIKSTPSPNWSSISPPYHFVDKLLQHNESQDVEYLLKEAHAELIAEADRNASVFAEANLICNSFSASLGQKNSRSTLYTEHIDLDHQNIALHKSAKMKYTYKVVPGFFVDILDNEDPEIQQIAPRFGLIDDSPTRWQNLKTRIAELNNTAPPGSMYKILFIGRHGQGFHNVAISHYGAEEWDRYWSKQAGDGNMTWGPDPLLTSVGRQQAQNINEAWKEELQWGVPVPERLYSSPFSRAVHTAVVSFSGIVFEPTSTTANPIATIKEKLREENCVSLCDKRNTRSYLVQNYPQFNIEEGFTEEDELWRPDHRETDDEMTRRLQEALDEIVLEDTSIYVSITAHAGTIRAIRRVLGLPTRRLPTGGVFGVVVYIAAI